MILWVIGYIMVKGKAQGFKKVKAVLSGMHDGFAGRLGKNNNYQPD